MTSVRPPAVAGHFYPDDPTALTEAVARYLAEAESAGEPAGPRPPKAIIAPHAGYVYSGPIAASAYARVRPLRGTVERVVLLGPAHRVAVRGIAASTAEAFATPTGTIPVDREAIERIAALPQVQLLDEAHRMEHSLEVHLPFLQEVLGDFRLVPLVVGNATAEEVAEVLDALWGGPETLIVVSSDLSHYHDYMTARRLDLATCEAIEHLDPRPIGFDNACGRVPISGLLTVAARRGLSVETVDLRNSGDTAGPRDQVVGYGAWVFTEDGAGPARAGGAGEGIAREEAGGDDGDPGGSGDGAAAPGEPAAREGEEAGETGATDGDAALLARHGPTLLSLAREVISSFLTYCRSPSVDPREFPPELREPRATFVTLHRDGRLRGCVGSSVAWRPLVKDVAGNALGAAFRDTRFPPVAAEELDRIEISISLLGTPERISAETEDDLIARLRPGIDGLILRRGSASGLFLPEVWESLPDPRDFLAHLRAKAGIPRNVPVSELEISRFTSHAISEAELAAAG